MPTYTAARAASSFPTFKAMGSGIVAAAWGSFNLTSNLLANDIINLCKIPAGAVVIGGRFSGADIDSNATETIDIDIGWAANGVEAADSDGFGNFGVLQGAAVTNVKPETNCFYRPLMGVLATNGPLTFTNETLVTATIVAPSATFAAGTIWVVVEYLVQ